MVALAAGVDAHRAAAMVVVGVVDHDETTDHVGKVEVAQLGRSHGLAGELYLRPLSDVPDRVRPGLTLTTKLGQQVTVAGLRPIGDRLLVRLEGVYSMEDAKRFSGMTLYAEPLDEPPVTLVGQLIGKLLVDQHSVDHGRVVAVQANPASELMVLENEALVPTLFIVEVLDDRVVIDAPEGLFEL
jgi:16S rRNA processing protein RimM